MFGTIIGLIGTVLGILALIGLIRGRTPLLKLKGRLPAGGVLLGGFVLMWVAGSLMPDSDVTLTFTPANAQVKLDGETYTQSPVKVNLTDLTRTVKASADGYHPQSVSWNTGKQKTLRIDLKKITAAELAAQRAEEARKAKEEAAAQAQRDDQAAAAREQKAKEAEAARAAAEANTNQQVTSFTEGEFLVQCKNMIRGELNFPDTAKFSGPLDSSMETYGNGNKDYTGTVRFKNGFDVESSKAFLCEFDLASQKVMLNFRN